MRKDFGLKPNQKLSPPDINELRKKTAAHMKKHNIKPLTDEELDEAIDRAMTEAAIERYNRSLPDGAPKVKYTE